jgi:hypothetical protein
LKAAVRLSDVNVCHDIDRNVIVVWSLRSPERNVFNRAKDNINVRASIHCDNSVCPRAQATGAPARLLRKAADLKSSRLAQSLLRNLTVMLSRLLASWLVVLIVAPFTAPFSTCDLATLADSGQIPRTRRSPSIVDAVSDDLPARSAPVALSNEVAIPSAPSVVRVGRGRLLRAVRISVRSSVLSSSSATFLKSAVTTPHVGEDAALRTVLRV